MSDDHSPSLDRAAATSSRLDVRVAPASAARALYASLLALLLSMVAISLFFAGAGGIFGPINDLLVVATVVLLIPAIIAVHQIARDAVGAWLPILTIVALAGIAIMAVGQLALVLGIIALEASFISGGIGVLMAIAWIAGLAVLSLRSHQLARPVGWWAVTLLVLVVITSIGMPVLVLDTATLSLVFGIPLVVGVAGWMVSLARDLAGRA